MPKQKKIKIEIKSIWIEVYNEQEDNDYYFDENIIKYTPEDIYKTAISVSMKIGTEGDNSADDFSAYFITESYINEVPKASRRKSIIIPYYDWNVIINKINIIIHEYSYYSWEEFCESIIKHFSWEYEKL